MKYGDCSCEKGQVYSYDEDGLVPCKRCDWRVALMTLARKQEIFARRKKGTSLSHLALTYAITQRDVLRVIREMATYPVCVACDQPEPSTREALCNDCSDAIEQEQWEMYEAN